MVKRSREQWLSLFKQHDESGVTAAQFCRENDLYPKYFAKRKKDLAWSTGKTARTRLVKLKKPKQNSPQQVAVTLQCGEVKLYINDTISPHWLVQVIKALA